MPSSTFIAGGNSTGGGKDNTNFTFAISHPKDSDDFFFHMSGPASIQWIAAGIGGDMINTLMIIVYADKAKKGELA